jgi:sporulation protein YlmC with PRC-barrel domain
MFTCWPGQGTEVTKGHSLTEEENVASEDRLRELEEKYEDYKVYDNQGEKIGKVDDLFVDETDREEYIGVKLGFLGMKSTLIPMDIVRVNEGERSIEVSESKDHVKRAPSFDDDEDITPDYEARIRSYFGLESLDAPGAGYGAYPETRSNDEFADREPFAYDAGDDTQEYEDRPTADSRERWEPTTEGEPSWNVPEFGVADETTDRDDRVDTGERSEGGSSLTDTGYSREETPADAPTTRHTEETETFEEGGRRKIRRRVIREEIYEEEDPNDRNL